MTRDNQNEPVSRIEGSNQPANMERALVVPRGSATPLEQQKIPQM